MSKERAQRRAEREREAALRAAARAAEQERSERQAARRAAVRSRLPLADRQRRATPRGPSGVLAERRRQRVALLVACLAGLQLLAWAVTPDWGVRLGVLVLSLVLAPLLLALTTR